MIYSSNIKGKPLNSVWQHVLLWLVIFLVYSYILSFFTTFSRSLILNLVNVPLFMAAYYMLKYIQLPFLFNKGKTALFIGSLFGSSVLLYSLNISARVLFLDQIFGYDSLSFMVTWNAFFIITIRLYSPALAVLSWESYNQRNKEKERVRLLENEKIATELKFLKAQINPHFLFNTLNNLYSFVVTESPKAPEMIKRLSGILDFTLNKSQINKVKLQEEVNVISDFIGLEQIRYGDRLNMEYHTEGQLDVPISPLILLSIVENAFKHGASGDVEDPSIKISIAGSSESIECQVWNTKSQTVGELNDAYKKGIGLTNIKRQLDLSYPDNHQLVIDNQMKYFSLTLIINIK